MFQEQMRVTHCNLSNRQKNDYQTNCLYVGYGLQIFINQSKQLCIDQGIIQGLISLNGP